MGGMRTMVLPLIAVSERPGWLCTCGGSGGEGGHGAWVQAAKSGAALAWYFPSTWGVGIGAGFASRSHLQTDHSILSPAIVTAGSFEGGGGRKGIKTPCCIQLCNILP
ncbi:unnamed protein product [Eretmochelys imbricata]